MIGQNKIKDDFRKLMQEGIFPSLCIITGVKGSGKKTLVDWFRQSNKGVIFQEMGISVEDVRNAITEAYRLAGVKVFYVFKDCDKMSVQAKNALLKVTEEPPENACFIMTLEDVSNTLPTIVSRATVFSMDTYTSVDLMEYILEQSEKVSESDQKILLNLCQNIGEVKELLSYGVSDFYEYVHLVVENIAEVSDSNSFKLADKISLKSEQEGYDLGLVFKAFMTICVENIDSNPVRFAMGVSITSNYLQQIGIKGVSKQMLLDDWIISIRKAWEA